VSEPEADPAPRRRSVFHRHRELGAAIVSGFVGALALATSTYNVYLQRQQVRAQVWPAVTVQSDYSNAVFMVTVFNRGVGPAQVKRVRVTVDGERAVDWYDAERRVLRRDDIDMGRTGVVPLEGQVLSPGSELLTFKILQEIDAREMFGGAGRLATEVCYCSTLGECWVAHEISALEPGSTSPVSECSPDPVPFHAVTHESLAKLQQSAVAHLAARARTDAGSSAAP